MPFHMNHSPLDILAIDSYVPVHSLGSVQPPQLPVARSPTIHLHAVKMQFCLAGLESLILLILVTFLLFLSSDTRTELLNPSSLHLSFYFVQSQYVPSCLPLSQGELSKCLQHLCVKTITPLACVLISLLWTPSVPHSPLWYRVSTVRMIPDGAILPISPKAWCCTPNHYSPSYFRCIQTCLLFLTRAVH